jgi:hypothetical protein
MLFVAPTKESANGNTDESEYEEYAMCRWLEEVTEEDINQHHLCGVARNAELIWRKTKVSNI